MQPLSEHRCFNGVQRFYAHDSRECGTEMRFSVYVPPQVKDGAVPVLYYLAGLTCTEETFMIKAGGSTVAWAPTCAQAISAAMAPTSLHRTCRAGIRRSVARWPCRARR